MGEDAILAIAALADACFTVQRATLLANAGTGTAAAEVVAQNQSVEPPPPDSPVNSMQAKLEVVEFIKESRSQASSLSVDDGSKLLSEAELKAATTALFDTMDTMSKEQLTSMTGKLGEIRKRLGKNPALLRAAGGGEHCVVGPNFETHEPEPQPAMDLQLDLSPAKLPIDARSPKVGSALVPTAAAVAGGTHPVAGYIVRAKRFKVGDRILALTDEHLWLAGTITGLDYYEDGWAAEDVSPYQILLDSECRWEKRYVFAPKDGDSCVRRIPASAHDLPANPKDAKEKRCLEAGSRCPHYHDCTDGLTCPKYHNCGKTHFFCFAVSVIDDS